jgi:hypothetical protein
MRKLAMVCGILMCTWLALGQPSVSAAEKPGPSSKHGRLSFHSGPSKSIGNCSISCSNGSTLETIAWDLEDCTCTCSSFCGGGCNGLDLDTGATDYCNVY